MSTARKRIGLITVNDGQYESIWRKMICLRNDVPCRLQCKKFARCWWSCTEHSCKDNSLHWSRKENYTKQHRHAGKKEIRNIRCHSQRQPNQSDRDQPHWKQCNNWCDGSKCRCVEASARLLHQISQSEIGLRNGERFLITYVGCICSIV